jgi:hypothetical protein
MINNINKKIETIKELVQQEINIVELRLEHALNNKSIQLEFSSKAKLETLKKLRNDIKKLEEKML